MSNSRYKSTNATWLLQPIGSQVCRRREYPIGEITRQFHDLWFSIRGLTRALSIPPAGRAGNRPCGGCLAAFQRWRALLPARPGRRRASYGFYPRRGCRWRSGKVLGLAWWEPEGHMRALLARVVHEREKERCASRSRRVVDEEEEEEGTQHRNDTSDGLGRPSAHNVTWPITRGWASPRVHPPADERQDSDMWPDRSAASWSYPSCRSGSCRTQRGGQPRGSDLVSPPLPLLKASPCIDEGEFLMVAPKPPRESSNANRTRS